MTLTGNPVRGSPSCIDGEMKMNTPLSLKIKVLFVGGATAAMFFVALAPEIAREVFPFMAIFVFVATVYYSPVIAREVARVLKEVKREGRPQATKLHKSYRETFVEPSTHIDYENYYIPTYLRQEGGRK